MVYGARRLDCGDWMARLEADRTGVEENPAGGDLSDQRPRPRSGVAVVTDTLPLSHIECLESGRHEVRRRRLTDWKQAGTRHVESDMAEAKAILEERQPPP